MKSNDAAIHPNTRILKILIIPSKKFIEFTTDTCLLFRTRIIIVDINILSKGNLAQQSTRGKTQPSPSKSNRPVPSLESPAYGDPIPFSLEGRKGRDEGRMPRYRSPASPLKTFQLVAEMDRKQEPGPSIRAASPYGNKGSSCQNTAQPGAKSRTRRFVPA